MYLPQCTSAFASSCKRVQKIARALYLASDLYSRYPIAVFSYTFYFVTIRLRTEALFNIIIILATIILALLVKVANHFLKLDNPCKFTI